MKGSCFAGSEVTQLLTGIIHILSIESVAMAMTTHWSPCRCIGCIPVETCYWCSRVTSYFAPLPGARLTWQSCGAGPGETSSCQLDCLPSLIPQEVLQCCCSLPRPMGRHWTVTLSLAISRTPLLNSVQS